MEAVISVPAESALHAVHHHHRHTCVRVFPPEVRRSHFRLGAHVAGPDAGGAAPGARGGAQVRAGQGGAQRGGGVQGR